MSDRPSSVTSPTRSLRRPRVHRSTSSATSGSTSADYTTPISSPSRERGSPSSSRPGNSLARAVDVTVAASPSRSPGTSISGSQVAVSGMTSPGPASSSTHDELSLARSRTPSSASIAGPSIEGYRRSPSYSAAKEYFESRTRSREGSVTSPRGEARSPGPAGTGGLPRKKSSSTLRAAPGSAAPTSGSGLPTPESAPLPLPPSSSQAGTTQDSPGRPRPSAPAQPLGLGSPSTSRRRSEQAGNTGGLTGRRTSLTPGSPKGPREQRRSSELRRSVDIRRSFEGEVPGGEGVEGSSPAAVAGHMRSPAMSSSGSRSPQPVPGPSGVPRPTASRPARRPSETVAPHTTSTSPSLHSPQSSATSLPTSTAPRRRPSRPHPSVPVNPGSSSPSSLGGPQPDIAIQQPTPIRTTHPSVLSALPSSVAADPESRGADGTVNLNDVDDETRATRRRSADLGRRPALHARVSPGSGSGGASNRRLSSSRGLGLVQSSQGNGGDGLGITEGGKSSSGAGGGGGLDETESEVVLNSADPSPSPSSRSRILQPIQTSPSPPSRRAPPSSSSPSAASPTVPSRASFDSPPQSPRKQTRSNSAASSIVIPRRGTSQSSLHLPPSPSRNTPSPRHTTPPPISPRKSSIARLADGDPVPVALSDEEKPKRPVDPDRRPSEELKRLLSSKLPASSTGLSSAFGAGPTEGAKEKQGLIQEEDDMPTELSSAAAARRASKAIALLGQPMGKTPTKMTEKLGSVPTSTEVTPTKPSVDRTDLQRGGESPARPNRNYQNLSIYPSPPPVIRTRRSMSGMNTASGSPISPGSYATPSPPAVPARNPLRLTSRSTSSTASASGVGAGAEGQGRPNRSISRSSNDVPPAATPTSATKSHSGLGSPADEIRFSSMTDPSVYSRTSGGSDTHPSTGTSLSFVTADHDHPAPVIAEEDAADSPISPASVLAEQRRPSIGTKRASLADSLTEQGVWGQKRDGMSPRRTSGAPTKRLPSPPRSMGSPSFSTPDRTRLNLTPALDRIQTSFGSPTSPTGPGFETGTAVPSFGIRSPSMPTLRRQDSLPSPHTSPRSPNTSTLLSTDMIPKRSSSIRSNSSSRGYGDGIPKRTSSILEDGVDVNGEAEDPDTTMRGPLPSSQVSPRRNTPKRDLLPSVLARSPTAPNFKAVPTLDRNVSTTSTTSTLSKRAHLLREIASTERAYATDLRLVCEAYIFRHPQNSTASSQSPATRPGSIHSSKTGGGYGRDGEANSPMAGSRRSSGFTIDTKRTSLFDGTGAGTPKSPIGASAGPSTGGEKDRESYFSPLTNGLGALGRKRTSASSITASTSVAATPLSATDTSKRGSFLSSSATPPTSLFSTTASSPGASQFTLTGFGQSGKVRGNPPTQAEMRAVFLNLVELSQAAEELARRLEKAVGEEEDGPGARVELNGAKGRSGEGGTDKIGQVFVDLLPKLRPLYLHYCVRQSSASLRLADLASSYSLYLSDSWSLIRPHTHAWNLETMLIKPVQRITKYPLLFQDLLDSTTPVHPDYFNIRKAAQEARKMAKEIDEAKRRKDIVAQAINRASSPIVLTSENALKPKEQKKGLKLFRNNKASPSLTPALTPTASSTHLDLSADLTAVSKRSMQQIVGLVEQLEQAAAATKRIGKEIVMWTAGVKEALNAEEEMMQTWLRVVVLDEGDRQDKRMLAFRGLLNDALAEDWSTLNDKVKNSVLPVFARLLESIVNPSRVVTKREHRLPDYQKYTALTAKRASPANLDRSVLQGAHDFTALHTQLVDELPIFLRGYMRILDLAMIEFAQAQASYYGSLRDRLRDFASKWIAEPGVATPSSVMSYRGPVDVSTGRGIVKAWHDSWVPFAEAMEHFQCIKPAKISMSRSASHNQSLRHSASIGGNLSPTAAHRAASRSNSPRPDSPLRSGSPLARTDSTVAALYRQNLEAANSGQGQSGSSQSASTGGRRRSASLRSPAVAALVSPVKSISRPGMFRNSSKSSLSGDKDGAKPSPLGPQDRPKLRDVAETTHRYSFGLPRISNSTSPGLERVFDELTVSDSPTKSMRSPSALSGPSTLAASLSTDKSDVSSGSSKEDKRTPLAETYPCESPSLDVNAGLGLGEVGESDRRISAISTASGASGFSLSSLPSIPSVRSRHNRRSIVSDVSTPASSAAEPVVDVSRRRSSGGARAFRLPPDAQVVHIPPPRLPSEGEITALPSLQEVSPDTPQGRGPAPSYDVAVGAVNGLAEVHAAVAATHAAEADALAAATSPAPAPAAPSVADGWAGEATIYLCACVADFDPIPWGNKTYRGLPFLFVRTGDILEVLHEVGRTQDAPGFPYPEIGVENDGLLVARSEQKQVGLVICSFLEPLRD